MSRSKLWSVSHSTGRIALATAAVATLAVIAACSEGGVAGQVAAPLTLRSNTQLPGISNAKLATVCVSTTSPDGTYTFVNSSFTNGASNTILNPNNTVLNALVTVPYTLTKDGTNQNPCVDVMTRTGPTQPDNFSDVTVTNTGSGTAVYSSTTCVDDQGVLPTDPCGNPSRLYAQINHGSRATFNFCPVTGCYTGPMFVVGDLASGLRLEQALRNSKTNSAMLNFWGSQWWKNNPMSRYSDNGWPSFKGYATTAGTCGETWTSRVGNSPPPPATIPDIIQVIVTDKVWKDGPDLRGNILAIITVAQDHGYGPNPGHDGNGPLGDLLCGSITPPGR